jgi:hypothetical protein
MLPSTPWDLPLSHRGSSREPQLSAENRESLIAYVSKSADGVVRRSARKRSPVPLGTVRSGLRSAPPARCSRRFGLFWSILVYLGLFQRGGRAGQKSILGNVWSSLVMLGKPLGAGVRAAWGGKWICVFLAQRLCPTLFAGWFECPVHVSVPGLTQAGVKPCAPGTSSADVLDVERDNAVNSASISEP